MIVELLHPESKHPKWEAAQINFDIQKIGLNPKNDNASFRRSAFYSEYKVLVSPKRRSDEVSIEAILLTVGVEALPDEIRRGNILYEAGNQLILPYGWSDFDQIKKLRLRHKGEYSFREAISRDSDKPWRKIIDLPPIDFISTKEVGSAAAKRLSRKFEKGLGMSIRPLPREVAVPALQSLQVVGK